MRKTVNSFIFCIFENYVGVDQALQILGVEVQLALLLEARFQGGSEQFVGGLPLLLQNLLFDFGFLLCEIVLVDGIVLRDAIDGPILARAGSDRRSGRPAE